MRHLRREQLFRAKVFGTENWVEGFYVHDQTNDIHYIYTGRYIEPDHFQDHGYTERVKIDPDTLGQYIGLTDINGKKIFEGDTLANPVRRLGSGLGSVYIITDIRYAHEMAMFLGMWEVVGNDIDNPEMLEEVPTCPTK